MLRQPSTTKMPRQTDDLKWLLRLWNSIVLLLTTVGTTGSTVSGTEKDIIHAIAGKQFMIRTWSMIGSNMSITVKMDNNTILNMSLCEGNDTNSTFQNSSMMLIYNTTIQEVYLLFENISKEDGGMYEIKENLYRTNTISDDNETDTYDRKDGTWYLEIYVLDSSEIKDGYVGANISMTFEIEMLKEMYTLQNYDLHGALLVGSTCSILTDSSLYGRLRCSAYDSGRMYTITIENISQRDAGLYKISHRENATGRCFFSIKESPTCAIVGENKTIGWFYNQQGIKRALRIIHPNQGVMMLVNQTNSPKIKSDFQHRLLYNGDILQSFMSFTLLNVTQSDAGSYIIETLHGNTIPGSKELNVEGTCTGGVALTTIHDVKSNLSVTQQMERHCVPISVVIPVVTVAVVVSIAILAMFGYHIWSQRKKVEAVQRLVVGKSEVMLIDTPSIRTRHPYRTHLKEEWVSRLTLSNDLIHHPDVAIPSKSCVFGTTGSNTVFLSEVEGNNHGVTFITEHNGLSNMTNGKIIIARSKFSEDGNLPSYPSVYALAKATVYEDGCTSVVEGMAISNVSAAVENAWRNTDYLLESDEDKPSVFCITNANTIHGRTQKNIFVSCDRAKYDGILDTCAPTCTMGSTAGRKDHTYKRIMNGNGSSQVSLNIQSQYAQIKKGPNIGSRNTSSSPV